MVAINVAPLIQDSDLKASLLGMWLSILQSLAMLYVQLLEFSNLNHSLSTLIMMLLSKFKP
jgi:hypothetical protein